MENTLSFERIAKAWKRMVKNPDKVNDIKSVSPLFSDPSAVRLKNLGEKGNRIHLRFFNIESAVESASGIPSAKRVIQFWLKEIAEQVQVIPSSTPDELHILVSTESRYTVNEVAVSIFRRDPKTNAVKRAYKCVGGAKDGRRVADPDQCLSFPDVNKRANLSISRRAKYGQSQAARTKTKLTNIVSKRVRKANQRIKKVRGI